MVNKKIFKPKLLEAKVTKRIDDYVHDERFDDMFARKGDGNVDAWGWSNSLERCYSNIISI